MLHLFCALPCEAAPFIDRYRLKEETKDRLFRLYSSEDNSISLVITGVGKFNAAASVSFHHACMTTNVADIWLNIGIAGHEQLAIGEACLANKITDVATGQCWYPQIVVDTPLRSLPLQTLDKPSHEYQAELYDMEAAGFYTMACRLGTTELIHCFKVISDNTEQNSHNIRSAMVKKLVTDKFEQVDDFINRLQPLSKELDSINSKPAHYEAIFKQWRFTRSQQHQLEKLLRQWQCREPEMTLDEVLSGKSSSKTVLQALRDALSAQAFHIVKNS